MTAGKESIQSVCREGGGSDGPQWGDESDAPGPGGYGP